MQAVSRTYYVLLESCPSSPPVWNLSDAVRPGMLPQHTRRPTVTPPTRSHSNASLTSDATYGAWLLLLYHPPETVTVTGTLEIIWSLRLNARPQVWSFHVLSLLCLSSAQLLHHVFLVLSVV